MYRLVHTFKYLLALLILSLFQMQPVLVPRESFESIRGYLVDVIGSTAYGGEVFRAYFPSGAYRKILPKNSQQIAQYNALVDRLDTEVQSEAIGALMAGIK
jgi:hypothetical protein